MMYTIGAPEVYDPNLMRGDLVKMGIRDDYPGGTIFKDVASARACIAGCNRRYHVYIMAGDYETDSYISAPGERSLIADTKIIGKVCPIDEI